jgi:hypothetical protein
MSGLHARLRMLLCLAIPPLLFSGCEDAPTVPAAIQQIAGGADWVALSAPAGLPRLESWTRRIPRSTESGRAALARIDDLERRSHVARRAGQLIDAAELRGEAERTAVLALAAAPDAGMLHGALDAIAEWTVRARSGRDLTRFPELAASVDAATAAHARALAALAGGDTTAATLEIAAGAEAIRHHTPESIALRVLLTAESRVGQTALEQPAAERATHLLANARSELVSGDPRRALHRALYALQIVEGSELRVVEAPPADACRGPGC